MPSHIALRGLPIENLKRKPFRTGALLAVVTILALTFFGGTMLGSARVFAHFGLRPSPWR